MIALDGWREQPVHGTGSRRHANAVASGRHEGQRDAPAMKEGVRLLERAAQRARDCRI
jgi:hypothetical protein